MDIYERIDNLKAQLEDLKQEVQRLETRLPSDDFTKFELQYLESMLLGRRIKTEEELAEYLPKMEPTYPDSYSEFPKGLEI